MRATTTAWSGQPSGADQVSTMGPAEGGGGVWEAAGTAGVEGGETGATGGVWAAEGRAPNRHAATRAHRVASFAAVHGGRMSATTHALHENASEAHS